MSMRSWKKSVKENLNTLRDIIRNPYAFPGGYQKIALSYDNMFTCPECLLKNYPEYYKSTRDSDRDSWDIRGCFLVEEVEGTLHCDDCGKEFGGE